MLKQLLFILVTAILIAGCSSGSPATPIFNLSETGGIVSATGIMGAYEVTVDTVNMNADLTAKRGLAIGESFLVSGMGFFDVAPCPDCLGFKSFRLETIDFTPPRYDYRNDVLVMTFHIKHPFKPGTLDLPPSGRNRRDLDVFDLAAVVYYDVVPTHFPLLNKDLPILDSKVPMPGQTQVYTEELSNVRGDNLVLPSVLIVDDSTADPPSSADFNRFAMGEEKDFDLAWVLPPEGRLLKFDLYLTMGYGASAKRSTRLNPKYYNPEFNRKAAWKVDVEVPPDGWFSLDDTTQKSVIVKVWDWQMGATVDPELKETNDVFANSEVDHVSLEIIGMFDTLKTLTLEEASGTGMPGDPLIFEFLVANENLLPAGHYWGCVQVVDKRVPGSANEGRDYLIHTDDGTLLNNKNIVEYATYKVLDAWVYND